MSTSLVLLFSDVLPLTFPHDTTVAAAVTSTYGSVFAKDIVFNRAVMVVDKADNAEGVSSTNHYYKNTAGDIQEFARQSFAIDSTATYGSIGFQTLRTVGGVQTIEAVMEVNSEKVVFNAMSSADSALESTMNVDYNGISFSRDTSAIAYGASSTFRSRFGPGEGPNGEDLYIVEALQTDGSYLTVQSITKP